MLEELLVKEEGKSLEFKENTQSLTKIMQTIIAFANTAGGTLVIGIRDKTKEVIGLVNALQDEEKISNAISDSIAPLLFPTIFLYTWRKKDVLIITVPHIYGPFYLKSQGLENSTFIRLGSTNRAADKNTISEIERLKNNKHFDELPNTDCPIDRIQFDLLEKKLDGVGKKITTKTAKTLELIVKHHDKEFPSNAAVLLLAQEHTEFFPDAIVKLGKFAGLDKTEIIDQQIIDSPISIALDPIFMFIQRHTSLGAQIGPTTRKDIPQYPSEVLREAIINSLLHMDYSVKGASITIAIFEDRIEITNPGTLPFGLSMEVALAGISLLRNKVIGKVFSVLKLIEQWGSGLNRMITVCKKLGIKEPKFEEIGNFFRVTVYNSPVKVKASKSWYIPIIEHLQNNKSITPKEAQKIWNVSQRTTTNRLRDMVNDGIIVEISTSPFDPHKSFALYEKY